LAAELPEILLMSPVVYRITTLLSSLVEPLPVGTNLGLFHLLWLLVSGRLLETRGAVVPGLAALGLAAPAVRRAWAALATGDWQTQRLVSAWQHQVQAEGRWRAHCHGGYRPVACDLVGFFRPQLRNCPTQHYQAGVGRERPAIPVGIAARVGSVGRQRLAIPCLLVRADPATPTTAALQEQLLAAVGRQLAKDEVLVADGGFPVAQVQRAGVGRYLLRGAKNVAARRAYLPAPKDTGRPPTRGEIVRPLPRKYKGRLIAATPSDRTESWQEEGQTLRAEFWEQLVSSDGKPGDPTFTCIVIHDPRYREPWVLLTNLPLSGREALALYQDRWPIEQLPLASKQMLGAVRQFVFAPTSRQRLPELALLAGSILSYTAATAPAVPTGFWDRAPRPTVGRLRRVLTHVCFRDFGPLPPRIRQKASPTDHLPKGVQAHRRQKRLEPVPAPWPLAA
jgi:hypothetical protein